MRLLRIEKIEHRDVNGKILWKDENINNIFHVGGQYFILSAAFSTSSVTVPTTYYLGLDNRATPATSDTLSSLSAEPTQNAYARQGVSSVTGFDVSLSGSNYRANSLVVTFSASGGSWGPIKNLFLATSSNNSGYLISTASLDSSHTLTDGQTLTMRISLGLNNC